MRNYKMDALIKLHWRIRDEILHRKKGTIGGYYNKNDYISKVNLEYLEITNNVITEYRMETEGNADT